MKTNKVKLLGLLFSLGLLMTTCKTAPIKPDKPDQVVKDPVPGTCEEFNSYVKKTGVTVMDNGKPKSRPGKAGSTSDIESFEGRRGPTSKSTEMTQTIKCGCTGKLYDEATTCINECKASLRCFTGICAPAGETQRVCLTTTLNIAFTSDTKIYQVDWQPDGNVSNACRAEIAQWNQRVLAGC